MAQTHHSFTHSFDQQACTEGRACARHCAGKALGYAFPVQTGEVLGHVSREGPLGSREDPVTSSVQPVLVHLALNKGVGHGRLRELALFISTV